MTQLMRSLTVFITSCALLITIDFVWLSFVMKDFYTTHLHAVNKLAESTQIVFNIPAAVATWALITLGIMLFVLPQVQGTSYSNTFLWGACFGFIVYGVYDLTNMATIKEWAPALAFYDVLWGTFLNGMLACIVQWINGKLL